MDIQTNLAAFGLTPNEIQIYLHLLTEGHQTPPQIAKGTGIARTNCYHLLQSLQDRGLISEQPSGKRKAYVANDPQAIVRNLERKKEVAEQLVPDLRAMYTVQKNKPSIRFFDGFEAVKEIYEWALRTEEKELFAIGSTKLLSNLDSSFFLRFQHEIKQRELLLNDIVTADSYDVAMRETKEIIKGMYDVKVLPEKYKELPTDIIIWDDHIALITLSEPIFGTVITSPSLARTFKILFAVMRQCL